MHLSRIKWLIHFRFQEVNGHGNDDLVFKAQQFREALRDPLVDDSTLDFADIHFLLETIREGKLGQKLLVLVEVATVLVDASATEESSACHRCRAREQ